MAEKPRASRTNIFLTDEDRAMIETIQREHGLSTASSAIRLAIRDTARRIEQAARRRPVEG
jgi:Arc/MetJ family transcription regulator